MLCGTRLRGELATVAADRVVASPFILAADSHPLNLSVVLGAGGMLDVVPLVFDEDGTRLLAGPTVAVAPRTAERTVVTMAVPDDDLLHAGPLHLGVWVGQSVDLAIAAASTPSLLAQSTGTPAVDLTLPGSPQAGQLQAFMLVDAEPPLAGTVEQQARRGVQTAAASLGGVADAQTAIAATCGWYGHQYDPDRGLLAIVRDDGPLAGLVGRRVLVSGRTVAQSVPVLVTAADDVIEDIALTRQAFMQLAGAYTEELEVTVEVIP